jgi:hypothetical protein
MSRSASQVIRQICRFGKGSVLCYTIGIWG